MTSNLGKNLVIVLTLVAAGFFWAWLVFKPYIGNEVIYTDGSRDFDVANSEGEVRYAVWEAPEVLPQELNTIEDERRAAISPDGDYLVFSVGVPGLGTDLYIADYVDGTPYEPRPLSVINTGYDEWAPSFSDDGLYFATDRPGGQGGLDLWYAPYSNGTFLRPAPLPDGLNTAADETDAAVMSDGTLIFSSNPLRGVRRDYDLYQARIEESTNADGEVERQWNVVALATLNTRFDEREPAITIDEQTLFFASDRTESLGGFDVFRSARGNNRWLAPKPLEGLNSPASERDPQPSREGFELLFSRENANRGTDLYRAKSRELFRKTGRPVGWKELLFLGLLVSIALIAGLAKKWEKLEIVYKCMLVSTVVHGVLMIMFNEVEPKHPTAEGEEDDRIRLEIRTAPEVVAPELAQSDERWEFKPKEPAEVAEPERAAVAVRQRTDEEQGIVPTRYSAQPELPELQGPGRAQITQDLSPGGERNVAVEVAPEETRFERFDGVVPMEIADLTQELRPETEAIPEISEPTEDPSRRAIEAPRDMALAPDSRALNASAGERDLWAPERDRNPDLARPEKFVPKLSVESETEAFERVASRAPDMTLEGPQLPAPEVGERVEDVDRETFGGIARIPSRELTFEPGRMSVPDIEVPDPRSAPTEVVEVDRAVIPGFRSRALQGDLDEYEKMVDASASPAIELAMPEAEAAPERKFDESIGRTAGAVPVVDSSGLPSRRTERLGARPESGEDAEPEIERARLDLNASATRDAVRQRLVDSPQELGERLAGAGSVGFPGVRGRGSSVHGSSLPSCVGSRGERWACRREGDRSTARVRDSRVPR